MGTQASVQSIDALKEFRVALALFSEEALSALGAVDMQVRRTVQWVQQDRPAYWQEQIKRRREQVTAARAEVFRRKLSQSADHSPIYSEQKELLRKAEESLREAEARYMLVRKWGPALQQAVLEYHASIQRIKNLAAGDIPRAVTLLERLVESLEAYLRLSAPAAGSLAAASGTSFDAIADALLSEEVDAPAPDAPAEPSEPPT